MSVDFDRRLLFVYSLRSKKEAPYLIPFENISYLMLARQDSRVLSGEIEISGPDDEEKKVKTPVNPKRAPIRTGSTPKN